MTAADRDVAVGPAVPGTTRIRAQALEHLAVGLVQDAAQAAHREISVRLADVGGALRVSVTVPVVVDANTAGSIVDRGTQLRRRVIEGMRDLAGRRVDVVDVRYSGVRRAETRRVR